MGSRTRLTVVLGVALLLLLARIPDVEAAGPVPPAQDPFYAYTGATPLGTIAPGTVLKHRSVQLTLAGIATPIGAEQLLYRTTDQLGRPAVTVTTVLRPVTGTVLPQI